MGMLRSVMTYDLSNIIRWNSKMTKDRTELATSLLTRAENINERLVR